MALPIFIVCHDNGWMVRDSVRALADRFPGTQLVVVDEASTAPRTLSALREVKAEYGVLIHRHRFNAGPKRVRRFPRYWLARRRPFILTDPDLDLSHLPADTIDVLSAVAKDQGLRSVGLALDISNPGDLLPGAYFQGRSIVDWESRFWSEPADLTHLRKDLEAYWAPIDTTFAYYDFSRPRGRQIRIAGEYTVRHLPWHRSYLTSLDPHDYSDYFSKDLQFGTTAALARRFVESRR